MAKRAHSIIFVAALTLVIFVTASLAGSQGESQQPRIAQAAPLFKLQSLSGDTLALADLRGKFVVIHFAASW